MTPKRLVLMVEGEGDVKSVPGLVQRMLIRHSGDRYLYLGNLYRIGEVTKVGINGQNFARHLKAITKQNDLGAVLLLLDADAKYHPYNPKEKKPFCVKEVARSLAETAKNQTTAGDTFSFAAIFARQEFESWILAGHPDFRELMKDKDVESHPRDAKGKIKELTNSTYRETVDQPRYAAEIDVDYVLNRTLKVRSFHRFDHAIFEIVKAVRTGNHIVSPMLSNKQQPKN